MKRTNHNKKPLWRNNGSDHYLADGTVVAKDERFRASDSEVPDAFKGNKLEKLEEGSEAQEEPATNNLQKFHKGGGRYVVYNMSTGQQYHESYLSKEQAEALVSLQVDDNEDEQEEDEE